MANSAQTSPARWRWVIMAIVLILVFVLARQLPITERLRAVLGWIQSQGSIGVVAFIAVYVLACVLFVPGSILTLGAGALYGPILGSVYVSIASVMGALASFLIGRFIARDWVVRRLSRDPRFAAIDDAVGKAGWRIVGLLRLSPVFPFNLLNYGLGVTQVKVSDYVWASWIGMMPGTVLYVYVGSLIGLALLSGEGQTRQKTRAEWIFYGVGLCATAVVTWYVTQLSKKALASRLKPSDT